MKHILILILFLGLISNVFCQSEKAEQPILNLSTSELENIGVFIKNNQIIVKNDMPRGDDYYLIIDKAYNPSKSDYVDFTKFDFYPYYITRIDSISGYHSQNSLENELKIDPLFERKMKMNYLVPVKVELSPEQVFLFWFQPTESFCKQIPAKYTISRKYIPDSLIKSNVALVMNDDELREIGFVIDNEEMYLRTCVTDNSYLKQPKDICEWYNNKKESGTLILNGNIETLLNEKDKKNKNYDIRKTDYFIVMVTDADGNTIYKNNDYSGLVVPIYIDNKRRPYYNKTDIVIYLSYTPSLVNKMEILKWNGWWSNPARYTVDFKNIDLLWQ